MTFGEKLKKLRADKNMTQEELAEKLYVTRTAVSKWETDKGYPGIDSLKQLSSLFGVSIDELVSDDDIENQKRIDKKNSRKFYWCAMAFLAVATVGAVVYYFAAVPYFNIVSIVGVLGYVVFAFLSKPKYKRVEARKMVVPYIISRLVILAVLVTVIAISLING